MAAPRARMVAMGRMPSQIIPSRVEAKLGNTRPGQSHSVTTSSSTRVWKCFVLPGVALTTTRFVVNSALNARLDSTPPL